LRSNASLVFQGVIPIGDGFKLNRAEIDALSAADRSLPSVVKPYVIGTDIVRVAQPKWIIDFFGLSETQARDRHPALFQRVLTTVKPVRDQNREPSRRAKWWLFARSNEDMRAAKSGLLRFIGTPDTSRHRVFTFLDGDVLPDAQVYCIAHEDPLVLGVLSSSVHGSWVVRVAPRLGVGNDIRWKPKDVWTPYPFPHDDSGLSSELTSRIRNLAEKLEAHRKRQQAAHPGLTLTGLYNVLEKLRTEEPLSAKEKLIHEQGLVSVLRSLHDELDAAVLQAYGWSDLAPMLADHRAAASDARAAAVDTLLERLVALNARRAAEEAAGTVRWLRPEFQNPGAAGGTPATMDVDTEADTPISAPRPKTRRVESFTMVTPC
jgi:hypothetical protein